MAYSLSAHYAGHGLLDSFSFFTGEDPSNGFVDYKSKEDAIAGNLVSVDEFNRVKLGVDSVNAYSISDKGRPSVRITSNDAFTHGLFIADFAHMPSSTCGTWPAFWAFNNEENGSLWPTGGEVDIIEGVNTVQRNLFSAHTTPGCQAPRAGFTGVQGATDCSPGPDNIGCNYAATVSDSTTYGDAFNAEGGGVYALEWDSYNIKIWHFPRTAIPNDISRAPMIKPDPTRWGPPQALFGGTGCEADSHFFNMSLVINTNFCGAYAGNVWGLADKCNELAPTCEEFVAGNPSSFINAFWQINYIDIYQKPAPTNSTSSPPFHNSTTLSTPPGSVTTSPSVLRNGTGIITRTRTVTVSTITQPISTAEPTRTGGRLADPATINGWTLLGCSGSPARYNSFSQVASLPTMDNAACITSCAGRKYAGVSGETCYCADTLGNASTVANEKCNIPCPGNPHEFCGGTRETRRPFAGLGIALTNATTIHNTTSLDISNPNIRVNPLLPRSAPSNILLTVYGNTNDEVPVGAPGMGSRPPKGEVEAKPAVAAVTSAVTVTFTTICPTDAARLITLEYSTTLTTQQPCRICTATAPAVPMTTCTETCDGCGPHGESTVMLTVPAAVAAGSGGAHVMAVAVQTVVPVAAVNMSPSSVVPKASYGRQSVSNDVPVAGAGTAIAVGGRTASFLQTLGYGLILWFGVFWIGIIL